MSLFDSNEFTIFSFVAVSFDDIKGRNNLITVFISSYIEYMRRRVGSLSRENDVNSQFHISTCRRSQ